MKYNREHLIREGRRLTERDFVFFWGHEDRNKGAYYYQPKGESEEKLDIAPSDSVCSGCLVPVPSDRYQWYHASAPRGTNSLL